MADFSFFWFLANQSNRLTPTCAIAIIKIMQNFMLKRDPQYRGVAEKIFFKLMGQFSQAESIQVMRKTHTNQAIAELALVDQ